MTKAFPDLKSTIVNAWGIGDYVIDEYEMTGTQKGPLVMGKMTLPATGKPVDIHGLEVLQLKDGKMVKGWGYENGVEFAMQLGLMKPPGQGAAAKAAAAAKATK
jgi:predicted ester cyclase